MKKEDYEKSKKEFEQEIEKNRKQIFINEDKINMTRMNQLEYKTSITLFLSLFPFYGLFALYIILGKCNLLPILNTIPLETTIFGMTGISFGVGSIIKNQLEKKYQLKNKVQAFSNPKTKSKEIENEVKYKMELEKVNNRNIALTEALHLLTASKEISTSLSNDNQRQPKIEELSMTLEKCLQELDLLTTKQVLLHTFWDISSKKNRILKKTFFSIMGGFFAFLIIAFPFLILQETLMLPTIFSPIITTLTPFMLGMTGTYIYTTKKQQDYIKAFHNLNQELNISLFENESFNEQLNNQKEQQIKKISLLHLQLQEDKRMIETEEQPKSKLVTYHCIPHMVEKQKTLVLKVKTLHHEN